ncbi:MAG: hypothetical protein GXO62_00490 [Epsilonproteobacteria bacterium]|nr:hypothetical protein [Campylobacterota bacterium]
MITYIMFGGVSLFVMFLFWYILKTERVIEQKFSAIELTLENINREIYELKKKEKISISAVEKIEKVVEGIVEDVRFLQEHQKSAISVLEGEIANLYNEIKKTKVPEFTNVSKHDESRIISLYKSGYTIEDIARELRIPAGEVEFIVKFSNISKP